jgi:hypothetical protein
MLPLPSCKAALLQFRVGQGGKKWNVFRWLEKSDKTELDQAYRQQCGEVAEAHYSFGKLAPDFGFWKDDLLPANDTNTLSLFPAVFRCTAACKGPKQAMSRPPLESA